MDRLVIEGGAKLSGSVSIHGAKNAALPILAASILTEGTHVIDNVPDLLDMKVMLQILEALGCQTRRNGEQITIDTSLMNSSHIPESLMRQMRSSVFLMGPLLARFGRVQFYQPGGCAIGARKIDLHLRGLEALGARIEESTNTIVCHAERLVGNEIALDFPSVGATENLMMAAVLAEGTTKICNAAREPEIEDLQNFLKAMGARISGAGHDTIVIEGVRELQPCPWYKVMPDRIVAGTIMIAAAATKGEVQLENVNPSHLTSIIHVLKRTGAHIQIENDIIEVRASESPQAVDRIITSPYPAFPTDLQAQMMALLSVSDGVSIIKETIFEGRFRHVDELSRMGANIRVDLNNALVRGVPRLYGARVGATDLRAGAALVIAGLIAEGQTIVEELHHIDRGYENISELFRSLGAHIERVSI